MAANDAYGVFFGINDLGLGDDEVNSASGDSGGPIFIDGKIAGVTSWGFTPGTPPDVLSGVNSSFGEFSSDARVSINAAWIDSIVGDPALRGPTVDSISPDVGLTNDLDITTVTIEFSEAISAATATDTSNYELLYAGLNGVFEDGGGDDELVTFTIQFDGDRVVELVVANAASPLRTGSYRLTLESSIQDVDGNPLNSTTRPGRRV